MSLKIIDVKYKDVTGSFIVRNNTMDEGIVGEVWSGLYFDHGIKVKEGDTVLDIGGHIGSFSVMCGNMGAKVYTFEPVTDNWIIASANVMASDSPRNIIVYCRAMTNDGRGIAVSGTGSIDGIENTGSAYIYDSDNIKDLEPSESIHNFLEEHENIDVMKLDCEGAEYEILFDLSDKELSKIKSITMEWHGKRGEELARHLASKGYSVKFTTNAPEIGCLYANRI